MTSMISLRKKIILLLSSSSYTRFALRILYKAALRQARKGLLELREKRPEILDLYALSDPLEKHFIFGLNELGLLLIIRDDARPKRSLKRLRGVLKDQWPLNMLVSLGKIPVLKEKEFKSTLIRSHLLKLYQVKGDRSYWYSLRERKHLEFEMNEQSQYALDYHNLKILNRFLLTRFYVTRPHRSFVKGHAFHIPRSIRRLIEQGILKNVEEERLNRWRNKARKIYLNRGLYKLSFRTYHAQSWQFLLEDGEKQQSSPAEFNHDLYPSELVKACRRIIEHPDVSDVIVMPALLQYYSAEMNEISGKVFLDVVISDESDKKLTARKMRSLQKLIDRTERELKKFDNFSVSISFTARSVLKLRHQQALFPFPLEGQYRKFKAWSVAGKNYAQKQDPDALEMAVTHFLLVQFMRFRFERISTGLIGSKFIKSLNLINRYALILDHLNGEELRIPQNAAQIRSHTTPQLSHLKFSHTVTKEDWPLIKSQLIYYLKKIRDNLKSRHPELQYLDF